MAGIKIFIGADHRGFKAKQRLVSYLTGLYDDVEIVDMGAYDYKPDDDFNDSAIAVAQEISMHPQAGYGILLCGSSFGVCMQANRFPRIRAINPLTPDMAKLGRQHNAANVLCLSADQLSFAEMRDILHVFLQTPPLPDARFRRRNQRLEEVFG